MEGCRYRRRGARACVNGMQRPPAYLAAGRCPAADLWISARRTSNDTGAAADPLSVSAPPALLNEVPLSMRPAGARAERELYLETD